MGKDVFGRPDYDPKRHTLVRVEVSAVRRKLAEYYTTANSHDRIHIEIPTGRYLATFSPFPAKAIRAGRRKLSYAIAGFAAILVCGLAYLLTARQKLPAHTDVPLQITFDTGWTSQPAVSRDGSVMVYASDRGPAGTSEIWIQERGKPPRQLTHDAAHDITPDISPDGKQVVFRSWRDEPGIWSVSADGQNLRLLAKGGYTPRLSPDGKWVAFSGIASDEAGHLFIVPSAGGEPEQLDYGTKETSFPVWSPDGSEIVFEAKDTTGTKYDLWRTRAHGQRREIARPLGVQKLLQAQNLPHASHWPQEWIGNRILFVTHERDTAYLLEASLNPSGSVEQIRTLPYSLGAVWARVIHGPEQPMPLLFATERRQTNIWGYRLTGAARLDQLTHDTSLRPGWNGTWPALSGDGNMLAFITERAGSPDICLRNLATGGERLLGAAPWAESRLVLDQDGSRVVFERKLASTVSIVLFSLRDKTDRVLTTECPNLQDWSSDGKFLLCSDGTELFQIGIGASGKIPPLHLPREPQQARFSPDARWVSFVSTTGQDQNMVGYLAPLDGSNRTINIDQETYTLSLHWAPDGNAVYYWSMRDGFRCLYMQRLDAESKVPKGAPTAILHRHGSQHYPWSGGTLAVGSGLIAFTLTDEMANIWKADLPP